MSGKFYFFAGLLFFPLIVSGELIKTTLIGEFSDTDKKVSRNIFSPSKMVSPGNIRNSVPVAPPKKDIQKSKEEIKEDRVIATVFYEGYLLKGDRKYALLKVNGQYYVTGEGDKIPGQIVLKKILQKKVVLEIESSEVTIVKKGERNAN